jgi:hemerythrin
LPAAVNSGRLKLARAVVRGQLPGWFRLHAATMDSALAAHDRQFSAAGNEQIDG